MSAEDDDEREAVDSDEVEAEAEAETETTAAAATHDEPAEQRSSEARRKLRDQVQADIERFLKSGGRIEVVDPSVNAAQNPNSESSAESG